MEENLNLDVMRKSCFLDPRFKDLKVIPKIDRCLIHDEVERELRTMNTQIVDEDDVMEPPVKKSKVCFNFDESENEDDDESFDEVKQVMERYKRESKPATDACPLNWWKVHEKSYRLLPQMAKKYLCVPATSVEAERRFSELGLLLTKRRLNLTGAHVDQQLFLKGKL